MEISETSPSLLKRVLLLTGLASAANAIIFTLGWDRQPLPPVFLEPPGWLVGAVWLLLFAAMATSSWMAAADAPQHRWAEKTPVWLALFCLAYPFYTSGLRSVVIGLAGDVATFAAALWAIASLWRPSRRAAWMLAPVAGWTLFASFLGVQMVHRFGWR